MATKKYLVETDKGSYEVEVEDASAPESSGTTAADMMTGRVGRQTVEHEPDTWMGGFTKSLKDQVLGGTVGNPMLQHAAHPQSLADVTSVLMAPVDTTRSVLAGLVSRGPAAVKAAAADTKPGILSKATLPFRAIGKFNDALPSNSEAAITAFRGGPKSAPVPPEPVTVMPNKPDLIDKYRTKPTPTNPPRLAGAKAPTLQDALAQAMNDVRETKPTPTTTSAPTSLDPAGAGTVRQSGKFGRAGSKGQAGGYTSGRPPITDTHYEELLQQKFGGRGPVESLPEVPPSSGGTQPATAVDSPVPVEAAAPKPRLSAEEMSEAMRLQQRGMTPDKIMESIESQRRFRSAFGTPSTPDMVAKVGERAELGRWDNPETHATIMEEIMKQLGKEP